MSKRVIDVACGSKMFWFDKNNPDVEFCDNRTVPYHEYYPHRYIEIAPDTVCDFTALPFEDSSFKLVVFDPPHLTWAGDTSWTALKYGRLKGDWKDMLRKGFAECFRVLDPDGVLIFKWSEVQIPLREILPLAPYSPLFGHRGGKNMNTHWLCFMKPAKKGGSAMTREDASEILSDEEISCLIGKFHGAKEALDLALSALRPVSREQVEKVWPGCPYCKEDGEGYVQKFGAYSIQNGELTTGHCKPQKIKFCPHCSRPLTDEAVEMVMERLEALKDGKGD